MHDKQLWQIRTTVVSEAVYVHSDDLCAVLRDIAAQWAPGDLADLLARKFPPEAMPHIEVLCGRVQSYLEETADDLQIALIEFMEAR